jgi:hypothetical protein
MALARRHQEGLEVADYRLAVLIAKNHGRASGEQQNTRCHELEKSFHNLLLVI